jgi:Fe-S-cluster containining protein
MRTFECTMCGLCCSNLGEDQMVLVLQGDIHSIAEAEGLQADEVIARYCESNQMLSRRAGRPITQLRSSAGRCVFLREDNRCAIHSYKPLQCRIGPDRLLPNAMGEDYDCMKGVVVSEEDDLTEYFFSKILEG